MCLIVRRVYFSNKPENPFQNYELAKKILEEEKKFLCLKNTLIQPLEVQKPETGQKTGPRTTGKILCANEPVWQKKFSYIKIFSIGPSEVQKPETGQKTGPRTNRKFLWMNLYENTNLPALEFFR